MIPFWTLWAIARGIHSGTMKKTLLLKLAVLTLAFGTLRAVAVPKPAQFCPFCLTSTGTAGLCGGPQCSICFGIDGETDPYACQ